MQVGDVVNMTHWTHFQPNIQVSYRAPKGRVGVFLLLGDADKKAPETFDAVGAIRALGWVPGTETDEADNLLAATSLEAGQKLERLENLLSKTDDLLLTWYEANARGVIKVDDSAYHIVTETAEVLAENSCVVNARLAQIVQAQSGAEAQESLTRELAQAKELLADVERRILRHQACVPMSRRESGTMTKIRADIKRHLGVIR